MSRITTAMKRSKKRKINGEKCHWGSGLDYLFNDQWDHLDRIVADNVRGVHNLKLINETFFAMTKALKDSIFEMKKLCVDSTSEGLQDWIRKARVFETLAKQSRQVGDRVIVIDAITQFLRETTTGAPIRKSYSKKKTVALKRIPAQVVGLVVSKGGGGIITGKAKIILFPDDFTTFRAGEILITPETNSSFISIMKKAKAIVTERGGMLCHAAIVARELKKPCIVGTKIATQVLNNGDIVEVDAVNGIVTIIK